VRAIVVDARQLSITEITRRYGFSWSTIMALVRTWSERVAEHRRRQRCQVPADRRDQPAPAASLRDRALNVDTGEALGVVESWPPHAGRTLSTV
jgi:hypothetical protein